MNCAHSARSFPSGGRSTNSISAIKMNVRVSKFARNWPEMRRPGTLMSAKNLASYRAKGSRSDSCQNLGYDPRRFHRRQLLLESLERIGEPAMVEAQHVKHGRMQVANLDRVFCNLITHLVSLAVSNSPLHPAACQPDREGAWVMVPADILHFLTVSVFAHGCAAKFASPANERILKHTARFQVAYQCAGRSLH